MSRRFESGGHESLKFVSYGPSSIPVGLERLHVQMRDLGVLEARVEKNAAGGLHRTLRRADLTGLGLLLEEVGSCLTLKWNLIAMR